MTGQNLTERMAELEREDFKFQVRILADQALEGLRVINPNGDEYTAHDSLPREVTMVLVYDKSQPVYLVYARK